MKLTQLYRKARRVLQRREHQSQNRHRHRHSRTHLSARDDDVLASIHDLNDAVGMHHREVASVEVPSPERLAGSFRVSKVLSDGRQFVRF